MHAYYKKSIAIILILGSLGIGMGYKAKTAEAVFGIGDITFDPANFGQNLVQAGKLIWEKRGEILQVVMRRIASKVLLKTTQKTINWALTGFEGDPFYVRNQQSFLENLNDQQLASIVADLNKQGAGSRATSASKYKTSNAYVINGQKYYCSRTVSCVDTALEPKESCFNRVLDEFDLKNDPVCITQDEYNKQIGDSTRQLANPFGKTASKTLIKGYVGDKLPIGKSRSFDLDKVIGSDWKKFAQGDFSKGGWKGWQALTSNPQNSPLGAYLQSAEDLADSIGDKEEEVTQELIQNKGFLSMKKCVEYKDKPKIASAATVSGNTGLHTDELDTDAGIHGDATIQTNRFDLNDYTLQNIEINNCARYETTTPGTVIAEQLNEALLTPQKDKQQKTNTGYALLDVLSDLTADLISRGLDNLISKQISKGTSGNSSSGSFVNNIPSPTSNWYNNGQTAPQIEDTGLPGTFNAQVKEIYDYTEKEIEYLKQIIELMKPLPQKTQELDWCVPGPDVGWENRLKVSYDRAIKPRVDKWKENPQYLRSKEQTDAYLKTDIQNIKQNIALSTPYSITINNKILQLIKSQDDKNEIEDRLLEAQGAFEQLKRIKTLLQEYRTRNNTAGIENLRKLYGSTLDKLGNEVRFEDAETRFKQLELDEETVFSKTNPDSLMSKCIEERHLAGSDVVGKDQGQSLYCSWQQPTASGTTSAWVFNDPIVPLQRGDAFTQTISDFKVPGLLNVTVFGLFGAADIGPEIRPLDLSCTSFYRAKAENYTGTEGLNGY